MDLRHLRYFQAVAEELSFSKAARRLHVAQPALSRTVKELEEMLGVEVLARTRRSVALTPAGAVLLNETRLLLQRLEEATRRVQRTAAGEEGELRLGFIGPPTQSFLGRIVKEFRRRYPRVTVVLEERTPERVWEMVARGRLDVGLTRPVVPHHASGLHTLVLRQEQLYAALPKGHRFSKATNIQWRQLANEPLIILSRREGVSLHDAVLAACRRARFMPNLTHTPSLIGTVLSYVEAGAGIGIISDGVCSLGQGLPLIFRPLSPVHTIDLVMVWSEHNDTPPAVAFRGLLTEWKETNLLWAKALKKVV
ncbi:MAG: LysR family transcriptional regulator [Verrucomicrobiales bacterium]|nr:LysR family transcriptional regulator [Verrucomicrobiales bacterium]